MLGERHIGDQPAAPLGDFRTRAMTLTFVFGGDLRVNSSSRLLRQLAAHNFRCLELQAVTG